MSIRSNHAWIINNINQILATNKINSFDQRIKLWNHFKEIFINGGFSIECGDGFSSAVCLKNILQFYKISQKIVPKVYQKLFNDLYFTFFPKESSINLPNFKLIYVLISLKGRLNHWKYTFNIFLMQDVLHHLKSSDNLLLSCHLVNQNYLFYLHLLVYRALTVSSQHITRFVLNSIYTLFPNRLGKILQIKIERKNLTSPLNLPKGHYDQSVECFELNYKLIREERHNFTGRLPALELLITAAWLAESRNVKKRVTISVNT